MSGPLTESEICGSSGNRRKFFLCRMHRCIFRYPTIVRLFRTMREYNVKQERPEAHPDLGPIPRLSRAVQASYSMKPVESAFFRHHPASPESLASVDSKLTAFTRKRPNAYNAVSMVFQPRVRHEVEEGRGGGHPSAMIVGICRQFFLQETACLRQVLFYCPFQVCVS